MLVWSILFVVALTSAVPTQQQQQQQQPDRLNLTPLETDLFLFQMLKFSVIQFKEEDE